MIFRDVLFNIGSFLVVLLLPSRALAQAGELALFFDASCTELSTVLPKVSLALSTCMVPTGVYGVVIDLLPACPNGATAKLIMYHDSGCAQQASGSTLDKCSWYFATLQIPAIMFSCDDPTTDPQPTSTFTAVATRIAGVATSQAGGSQSTNSAAISSNPASTMTGGTSSPTSESGGNSASSSPSVTGSSGLATSDKIAIGVGLGVGVPTIIISLAAWLWPR